MKSIWDEVGFGKFHIKGLSILQRVCQLERERKGKREVVNLQEMTTEILSSENVLSYFYDQ